MFLHRLFLVCMLMSVSVFFAQDDFTAQHTISIGLTEVALMSIEGDQGTSVVLGAQSNEAGEALDFTTDSSLWVNYSSVIASNDAKRKIVASITQGSLPAGIKLRVIASDYEGVGDGLLGKPRNKEINLNARLKTVIRRIGTCYTGEGVGNGHRLNYRLQVGGGENDYENIRAIENTTLVVTYTILDN